MPTKYDELSELQGAASSADPSTGGGAARAPPTAFESLSDRLGSPANKLNPKTAAPKRAYAIAAALLLGVSLLGWLKIVTAKRKQAAAAAAVEAAPAQTEAPGRVKLELSEQAARKRQALLDSAARASLVTRLATSAELQAAADRVRNNLMTAERIAELEQFVKQRDAQQSLATLAPSPAPTRLAPAPGASGGPAVATRLQLRDQDGMNGAGQTSTMTYKPIDAKPGATAGSFPNDGLGRVDLGDLSDSSLAASAKAEKDRKEALAQAKREADAAAAKALADSLRQAELKELGEITSRIVSKREKKARATTGAAGGSTAGGSAGLAGALTRSVDPATVVKPGTKVVAQMTSPFLSLTADLSGVQAVLMAPVRAKDGSILLPSGTIAYGSGQVRGATTGLVQPRVIFTFNHYQLPNGDMYEGLEGLAFDVRDGLPGIPGSVNRRLAQRTLIAGAAAGAGILATAGQNQPVSALLQPSPAVMARQDLARQLNQVAVEQFGSGSRNLMNEVRVAGNTVMHLVFNVRAGRAQEQPIQAGQATLLPGNMGGSMPMGGARRRMPGAGVPMIPPQFNVNGPPALPPKMPISPR